MHYLGRIILPQLGGGSLASLIEIQQLSVRFGGIRAIDDLSLSLEADRITAIIGPNGAGKTTLFNTIAGHVHPSAGRVRFSGEDVTGSTPEQLFHKGLVRTFQIPHEFHRMTVLENLLLVPGRQRGERLWQSWLRFAAVRAEERDLVAQAEEVLDRLGLGHVRDELAGNLSGGQKKLLELGRTMMTAPKLVLLDEPAAGVNRTLLRRLVDFIRYLHTQRGYSFCIIEHDMDLVAELCDPVIVMAEGRLLTQGPMAEVRRDPRVLSAYLGADDAHVAA